MPTYPNVPDVPGVPPVLRQPGISDNNASSAIGSFAIGESPIGVNNQGVESVTVTGDSNSPQWGLFKDGKSVIEADNVVGFEFKRDWAISDYNVEKGGFESYNKVQLPFDVRIRFSCGGAVTRREAFLKSIEAIENSLDLYDAVVPEKVYIGCNVQHVDYRRTASNGVGLIVADIYLLEIRDTATAAFASAQTSPASSTATKSPSAQAKRDNGPVQAKTPSTSDQRELDIARGMALAG